MIDYSPIVSLAVALLALVLLLKGRLGKLALDQPNQRSLHTVSVPRTGGLAILCGIAAGWAISFQAQLIPFAAIAGLLAVVSFFDDLFGLPVAWRFLAHIAAAAGLTAWLLWPGAGYLAMLVAVLCIVWMINLYNFMDGSDGLAGGMACFGFASYGVAAGLAGNTWLAMANWSVVGAAAAFLLFNFPPAKIFMGDAGSIPLGFLAAAFGLLGWKVGYWPFWFPVAVFSPFIVDATVTLSKRLLRGERIWHAHRQHYYQRLVQSGCGHRCTALLEYALMAACSVAGLWALNLDAAGQLKMLLAGCCVYFLFMFTVDRRWTNHTLGTSKNVE